MSLLTVERLELKNFMTHRSEQVSLPTDGTILLWGPSGSGKSSLLDAVGFALFGLSATRASSLEELRHELYPEEDFGVRLTLSMGDKKIQVFRGVESGKTVVWMVGADGEMTEGARAVSAQVSELLGGMDAATFFATYYSQQGELDALVKMAGGGRRKFVQRMLGINLLDKVSTQINRELLKASERILTLDGSLPDQPKHEIAEQAQQAEREAGELGGKIDANVAQLEAVKLSGEKLAERLKVSEAAFRAAADLPPKIEALRKTTIPALQAEIVRLEEQQRLSAEAAQRVADSSAQAEQIEELKNQAETLSKAEGQLQMIESLQQAAREAEAALKALPEPAEAEDPRELQASLHALHTEVAVADARAAQLAAQTEELQGAGSCPLCRQVIADPEALLSELQKEAGRLKEQQQLSEEQQEALQERLKQAAEALEALEGRSRAEQRHKEALEALTRAEQGSEGADAAKLKQIRSQLEQSAEITAKLEADRALAGESEKLGTQLQQTNQKLQQAETELKQSERQLKDSSHDPSEYESLKQQTDQAREEYLALRDQLAGLREARSEVQAQLESHRRTLEHYDATVEDRRKAETRKALLARLDTSMKAFKSHMVGQIRPTLQAAASGHLSALTEGKMSGVLIDEEYSIEVVTPAGQRKLSLCSGGEQARVAFALRLALTQLVSSRTDTPVGFMVFDEIFGSQDEDHRRAILESLRYLRGLYPQVLLISHESSLRESDLIDTIVEVPNAESQGRIVVSAR